MPAWIVVYCQDKPDKKTWIYEHRSHIRLKRMEEPLVEHFTSLEHKDYEMMYWGV